LSAVADTGRRACGLLLAIAIAAAACEAGDDDDGQAGCTYESCAGQCLAAYADDLENCGGICAVESLCLTSGECRCAFYPCHEATCQEYCIADEGLGNGGCGAISGNILACDCW
jgi:hypothetical protein